MKGAVWLLAPALLAACTPLANAPPASTPPAPAAPVAPTVATVTPAGPIPGFQADAAVLAAFRRACPALLKRRDASGLTRPADWQAACTDSSSEAAVFFQRHFQPVQLGDGKGLATGYYEPLVPGRTRPAPGAAAIYARPPELVDIDLAAFGVPPAPGTPATLRGMAGNGRVVPAPDRAAIEDGALAGRGLELGWADDPVDLFFLQIQGSGRLQLPDGRSFRLGYAGQNGHPYVAIGKLLRERKLLEKAGMAEIRQWLAANPEAGRALMRENPSYIFFRRLPDTLDGPIGSLGVPLLAGLNAAADQTAMPLGAPVWLETMVEGKPVRRLLIAADTGGAIRGANRFDIFFGAGADAARKAGALAAPAKAWILLPLAAAQRLKPPESAQRLKPPESSRP